MSSPSLIQQPEVQQELEEIQEKEAQKIKRAVAECRRRLLELWEAEDKQDEQKWKEWKEIHNSQKYLAGSSKRQGGLDTQGTEEQKERQEFAPGQGLRKRKDQCREDYWKEVVKFAREQNLEWGEDYCWEDYLKSFKEYYAHGG